MADPFGEFLRARRAGVDPAAAGLVQTGRRRVPGLRREELAQLAGVSVDYYTRMEQGRVDNVSDHVLDSVARALGLDQHESAHLRRLARQRRRPPAASAAPQRVRPALRWLVDSLEHTPAFVLGRRMEILTWNRLAAALITDFGSLPRRERNLVRLMFLDPSFRELFTDWAACARENVAFLRLDAGYHPDDPHLADLVGELSVKSSEFRRWWATHPVKRPTYRAKHLKHPMLGELDLSAETLRLADNPSLALVTYTAEPGSTSADALRLLGSLTETP